LFLWPHTANWDGEGTINVFPDQHSVKNYRLDATMDVKKHWNGWFNLNEKTTYTNIVGSWPNEGKLEIEDCVVNDKDTSRCSDQDNVVYGIEVMSAPDAPEVDYPENY
jgi:hypothetical protein